MSLVDICQLPGMPSRRTVQRWADARPGFDARCARARILQADLMDDLILKTAEACTPETAAADRVKISAYQWRASKLAPKKYGEKVQHAHEGADGGPIAVKHDFSKFTDAQLRDFIALSAAARSGTGGPVDGGGGAGGTEGA